MTPVHRQGVAGALVWEVGKGAVAMAGLPTQGTEVLLDAPADDIKAGRGNEMESLSRLRVSVDWRYAACL